MNPTPFVLETPNGPLRGDVYTPDQPRGASVVVGCHGFKGFKDWGFWPETGRYFAESGLVLVTFNFSGSGIGDDLESFTELDRFEANTIGKELEDLGAILDAVTARNLPVGDADTRRLGVLGHSRGGGVSLVRTGRDPRIRALVTWASVSSFHRFVHGLEDAWREQGYQEVTNQRTGQVLRMGVDFLDDLEAHTEVYDPKLAISRVEVPTLILHGTQDESVPVTDAQELAQHADPGRSRLALIQGTGHTFGAVHPFLGRTEALEAVLQKSTDWFVDTLS